MHKYNSTYKNYIKSLHEFSKHKTLAKFTWLIGENQHLHYYATQEIKKFCQTNAINYKSIETLENKNNCPPWEQTGLFVQKTCYHINCNTNNSLIKAILSRIYLHCNNNIFVFSYNKNQIPKSFELEINNTKNIKIFCPLLKNYETKDVILHLLKKFNLKLPIQGVEILKNYLGHDLHRIENEIKKLSLIFVDNKQISINQLENELGLIREDHIFEIQNFILTNKQSSMYYLLNNLLKKTTLAISIIGVLARFCRNSIKIKQLLEKNSPSHQITKEVKLPQFILKLYENYLKTQSQKKLFKALKKCQQADLLLKTKNTIPGDLIIEDILQELWPSTAFLKKKQGLTTHKNMAYHS